MVSQLREQLSDGDSSRARIHESVSVCACAVESVALP